MRALRLAGIGLALGLAGAGAALLALQSQGVTPREVAPYIEKRSSGHNPLISGAGSWLGAALTRLDRGADAPLLLPPLAVGAQPQAAAGGAGGVVRLVASVEEAQRAFASAAPGDAITFAPGVYRLRRSLYAGRAGTAAMPVVVRAQQPDSVTIEFATVEGFVVAAPYWRFENLRVRGVCGDDSLCEHAFHVVANGAHFAAVNNTVLDFNAHFKINGDKGAFPDDGLIEGNTLGNTHARMTAHPVTPIDLVAASGWTIRANLISDFVKAGGDRISYGAFAKGAGRNNVFERNVVWCEQRLRGLPGQRVGLSLGGGGTGKPYCRDRQCISEQQEGVVRDNLIASCSDAGIYVNSASVSRVEHNTLLDTAGIDVRFPTSSATLEGNLVDGAIRARNDAVLHPGDNRSTALAWSYLGRHPVRALFRDVDSGDLGWRDDAPRASREAARPDLCGRPRAASPAYGAFEDYAACLRPAGASSATSSSKSAS
jgi:hypothetical protein